MLLFTNWEAQLQNFWVGLCSAERPEGAAWCHYVRVRQYYCSWAAVYTSLEVPLLTAS